jgi:hypothetical protein
MPHILEKGTIASSVKRQILEVCGGSEERMPQLASLDWGFVLGGHPYHGKLDLARQITCLELQAERISIEFH